MCAWDPCALIAVWPHPHRDCPLLPGPVPWTPWEGGKRLSNCSLLLETCLFTISWLLLVPGPSPMVRGFSSWVPISVGGTTTRPATETPILNVTSLPSSLLSTSASLFCLQCQSPVTPGPERWCTPVLTTSWGCSLFPHDRKPFKWGAKPPSPSPGGRHGLGPQSPLLTFLLSCSQALRPTVCSGAECHVSEGLSRVAVGAPGGPGWRPLICSRPSTAGSGL